MVITWIGVGVTEVDCSGDIRQIFRIKFDRKVDMINGKDILCSPRERLIIIKNFLLFRVIRKLTGSQ